MKEAAAAAAAAGAGSAGAAAGGPGACLGTTPLALRGLRLSLAYSGGRLRDRISTEKQRRMWRVQDAFLDALRLQIVRALSAPPPKPPAKPRSLRPLPTLLSAQGFSRGFRASNNQLTRLVPFQLILSSRRRMRSSSAEGTSRRISSRGPKASPPRTQAPWGCTWRGTACRSRGGSRRRRRAGRRALPPAATSGRSSSRAAVLQLSS